MVNSNIGRVSIHRSSAIPGAEVLAAYGNQEYWHVFHERFSFCACRTASADWRYRRNSYSMRDGTVAFMQPGEVHRNTAVRKPSDFKVLMIEHTTLMAALEELGHCGQPKLQFAQSDDLHVARAVHQACWSIETAAPLLEQQILFTECVRALASQMEKAAVPNEDLCAAPALTRARQYIIDRYDESISLYELAKFSGLSRFHLVRAFQRQFGLPPHAFQLAVRIERARDLLRNGATALEASMASGFADQSHFTRHFKSVYRVTPGQYAQAL